MDVKELTQAQKEFISQYGSFDYSAGGSKNYLHYPTLKEDYIPFMEAKGLANEGIMEVHRYFELARELDIIRHMQNGVPRRWIEEYRHYSYKMIRKVYEMSPDELESLKTEFERLKGDSMQIVKGIQKKPVRCVIYGPEGIGKSTLASRVPNPLYLDIESGTGTLDVTRISEFANWQELLEALTELTKNLQGFKTIVIDTADRAEQLCIDYICTKYSKKGIEDFGYGKGYTYVQEEFSKLLALCDKLLLAGANVIVIAHAKMRKFEQPDEMGTYDRWELKLSKTVAPIVKEWCDMLLFLNYKTVLVTDDNGKNKATGGKRVMYTTHHPCWDAKNRFGLPDEMELSYSSIESIFTKEDEKAKPETIEKLLTMLKNDYFSENDFVAYVESRGKMPKGFKLTDCTEKFMQGWALKYYEKILNGITEMKEMEIEENGRN